MEPRHRHGDGEGHGGGGERAIARKAHDPQSGDDQPPDIGRFGRPPDDVGGD
ncbi:hypothetical protein D3C73_1337500 [compost metagenome]